MYKKRSTCTIVLIVINAAVFVILSFLGRTEDGGFMLEHGAMYVPYVIGNEQYYRLFTSMFLHFGITHLTNNLLMLRLLGWNLETEVGGVKFLIIYLLSGLGGNLLSAVIDIRIQEYAVAGGASGAIFGIIGALLYIAIRNHGHVGNVTGRGILFMIGLSLYFGFTSTGVDNFAHIGGLLAGFLACVLLYRKRNCKAGAFSFD